MIHTAGELIALAQSLLTRAEGEEQVEVFISETSETKLSCTRAIVDSYSAGTVSGIGIRVIRDGRLGYAYTGTLDSDAAATALVRARLNADVVHATSPVPQLPRPRRRDLPHAPEDRLIFNPSLNLRSFQEKVELALALDRLTVGIDQAVGRLERVEYADNVTTSAVASTTGVRNGCSRTSCSLEVVAIADDRGVAYTGYGDTIGRDHDDLDLMAAAREAVYRAKSGLGRKASVVPKGTPVVFDGPVTTAFLTNLAKAFCADSILANRSFISARKDFSFSASPNVTLADDRTDSGSLGALPMDAEGVPTRPVRLIHGGSIEELLHDATTAPALAHPLTGSAVRGAFRSPTRPGARAVTISAQGPAHVDSIADLPHALVITTVPDLVSGMNLTSGLFSFGASGYLAEAGASTGTVPEIVISGDLRQVFRELQVVGEGRWSARGAFAATICLPDIQLTIP